MLALFLVAVMFWNPPAAMAQSVPVIAGYRDFNFGAAVSAEPTFGESQSKLWWHEGLWWGMLWNPAANRYEVHRLDSITQSWVSTGTAADDRAEALVDVLSEGAHLYAVSHVFVHYAAPTTVANSGRLYRYSYNAATKSYAPDPGFPVNVNRSKSEALVLDKDSTGKLWVTWMESGKIMVNRSLSNDSTWGVPFVLPVQGGDTDADDISTLVAFGSTTPGSIDRIGVMWSNQRDSTTYFAVHRDGDPDQSWQPRETALSDRALGRVSEDHLSLKAACDDRGNLYAAAVTNLSGSQAPGIFILKRAPNRTWTRHVFSTANFDHARPLLLVDNENQRLYVFARSTRAGTGVVYLKSAGLDDLAFPVGLGAPVLASATDLNINNPTATKQCLNSTSGILLLAADRDSRYYLHSYIDPAASAPKITAFMPARGPAGTEVTIMGSNFNSTTQITFNGLAATRFSIDSNTQLRAQVPAGARTGPIRVTNAVRSSDAATNFRMQYTLTAAVAGSGNVQLNPPGVVTVAGSLYEQGASVSLTAMPAADWEFSHWEGDLVDTSRTGILTMNADKRVTAHFKLISHFKVTINVIGTGEVTLDPPGSEGHGKGIYERGALLKLTATPASGYVFSGYGGDFKGWRNVETMAIDAAKNLTATFSPQPSPRFPAGIWTSSTELAVLPAAGMAWDNLKRAADEPAGTPNLSDQEDSVNVVVLAKALVYARTGQNAYRQQVIAACMAAIGTERSGETLALGRELLAYILAADLVGLPPEQEAQFRQWLRTVLTQSQRGQTLRSSHATRPNNWGTHCGATRAAIARYLGDSTELERTARIFKGWLGDRNSYADFSYGERDWQFDPNAPVGINPRGARKNGHSIDGVLPDDQRRAGGFTWPPPKENYVYGALQGALAQAIILFRAGYDVWSWQDQALLRALLWLYTEADYQPQGDDEWLPHIVNRFYKTDFPASLPARPGKNAGWTDWLYGSRYALAVHASRGKVRVHAHGENPAGLARMTLHALPDSGYLFAGWSGDLSGRSNPDTLLMNSSKTVTANFARIGPFTLAVSLAGSGKVRLNPPGGTYLGATAVTLTAEPDSGFAFKEWSGDLTGMANPATVTMLADKSITATFKANYTLTVEVVGSGTVTVDPPGGRYDAGTVVRLTATPAAGAHFDGWGGDLTGLLNSKPVIMDANKRVKAIFSALRIVHRETRTGASSSSAVVAAAMNSAPPDAQLYLAAISTRPATKVLALSGLGLNWTQVKAQCSGRNTLGMELWMAQGAPIASDSVTARLEAAATNAVMAVSRYTGAMARQGIGNIISVNTAGANGDCSSGVDTSAYSSNLSTSLNGALAYVTVAMRNVSHLPAAGYAERAEVKSGNAGSMASLAVAERSIAAAGAVAVRGSFSGASDWAMIAVEIKPSTVVNSVNALAKPDTARNSAWLLADFHLLQNYPNPFNAHTTIQYHLRRTVPVGLFVYNLSGRKIRTLVEELQAAGLHQVQWNGHDEGGKEAGSGLYVLRMEVGRHYETRMIILLK